MEIVPSFLRSFSCISKGTSILLSLKTNKKAPTQLFHQDDPGSIHFEERT